MVSMLSIQFGIYIHHILSRSIFFFGDMTWSKSLGCCEFSFQWSICHAKSPITYSSTIIHRRWWFKEKGMPVLEMYNYNNSGSCVYVYWADNMFMLKCCSHVCPTLVLIDDVTTEEEGENGKFLFLYCWDVSDDASKVNDATLVWKVRLNYFTCENDDKLIQYVRFVLKTHNG